MHKYIVANQHPQTRHVPVMHGYVPPHDCAPDKERADRLPAPSFFINPALPSKADRSKFATGSTLLPIHMPLDFLCADEKR